MLKILKKIGALVQLFAAAIGWLSIFSVLFLLVLILTLALMLSGRAPSLEEIGSQVKGDRAVSVLDLEGEIGLNLDPRDFIKDLNKQAEDSKVKGVVVRIESPGGTVGGSEEINAAIRKAREKKPVVCSLGNVAASGGVYIAAACDKIVTNKGTLTGSIGVIMMMPNFSAIMSKYDLEMNVIKSGEYKDSGSPFRKLSDPDRELWQTLVKKSHDQFIKAVADGRGIKEEDVRKFADGRVILGEDAVALGLADEIGDVDRAAKLVLEKLGLQGEPELFYPDTKKGLEKLVDNLAQSKLFTLFSKSTSAAQLRYQWFY